MKISEILRLAADEFLSATNDHTLVDKKVLKTKFTCCAVSAAAEALGLNWHVNPAREFYDATFGISYLFAFDEFEAGIERQSVRFAWLHMAADYAEEQGL